MKSMMPVKIENGDGRDLSSIPKSMGDQISGPQINPCSTEIQQQLDICSLEELWIYDRG